MFIYHIDSLIIHKSISSSLCTREPIEVSQNIRFRYSKPLTEQVLSIIGRTTKIFKNV